VEVEQGHAERGEAAQDLDAIELDHGAPLPKRVIP
jgi:hypothetical protein